MPTIADYLTDEEILHLIGERFRDQRLGRNMALDTLASRSGVNRKTASGFEAGKDMRLSSLIKLLRGLGMLHMLEAAFPDVLPGGEGLTTRDQPRQKAYSGRKTHG